MQTTIAVAVTIKVNVEGDTPEALVRNAVDRAMDLADAGVEGADASVEGAQALVDMPALRRSYVTAIRRDLAGL